MDINGKYLIDPADIRTVVDADGNRIGFEFTTLIPYYRGVALSMVDEIRVKLGNAEFPKEMLRFTVDGHTYAWPQIETVTTLRWEYGQKATVFVPLEGGLPNSRTVPMEVFYAIRMSYLPKDMMGSSVRLLVDARNTAAVSRP
jgi:hypothetical protein